MVGTILPVVYGARDRGHRSLAHWVHALASVFGAALFGFALGSLGQATRITPETAYAVTFSVAAGYVLRSLGLLRLPAPERSKQVPASWRAKLSPSAMASSYGAALGIGVLTHIWALSVYPILVWVTLGSNPIASALAWSAFGLGRALRVILIERRTQNVAQAFAISGGLERWSLLVRVADGLILSLVAGLFIGLLFL